MRPVGKRPRPEGTFAKPRQADESLANGGTIAEVTRSPSGVRDQLVSPVLHRWRVDRDAVRGLEDLEKENARLKHPAETVCGRASRWSSRS